MASSRSSGSRWTRAASRTSSASRLRASTSPRQRGLPADDHRVEAVGSAQPVRQDSGLLQDVVRGQLRFVEHESDGSAVAPSGGEGLGQRGAGASGRERRVAVAKRGERRRDQLGRGHPRRDVHDDPPPGGIVVGQGSPEAGLAHAGGPGQEHRPAPERVAARRQRCGSARQLGLGAILRTAGTRIHRQALGILARPDPMGGRQTPPCPYRSRPRPPLRRPRRATQLRPLQTDRPRRHARGRGRSGHVGNPGPTAYNANLATSGPGTAALIFGGDDERVGDPRRGLAQGLPRTRGGGPRRRWPDARREGRRMLRPARTQRRGEDHNRRDPRRLDRPNLWHRPGFGSNLDRGRARHPGADRGHAPGDPVPREVHRPGDHAPLPQLLPRRPGADRGSPPGRPGIQGRDVHRDPLRRPAATARGGDRPGRQPRALVPRRADHGA